MSKDSRMRFPQLSWMEFNLIKWIIFIICVCIGTPYGLYWMSTIKTHAELNQPMFYVILTADIIALIIMLHHMYLSIKYGGPRD